MQIKIEKDTTIITFGICTCCGRKFGYEVIELKKGVFVINCACFGPVLSEICPHSNTGTKSCEVESCKLRKTKKITKKKLYRDARKEVETILTHGFECILTLTSNAVPLALELNNEENYTLTLNEKYIFIRKNS